MKILRESVKLDRSSKEMPFKRYHPDIQKEYWRIMRNVLFPYPTFAEYMYPHIDFCNHIEIDMKYIYINLKPGWDFGLDENF